MRASAVQVAVSEDSLYSLMALHASKGKAMVSGRRTREGRYLVRLDPDVHAGLLLVDQDIDRAIARVIVSADQEPCNG